MDLTSPIYTQFSAMWEEASQEEKDKFLDKVHNSDKKKAAKEKLRITSPGPVNTAALEPKPISTIVSEGERKEEEKDGGQEEAEEKMSVGNKVVEEVVYPPTLMSEAEAAEPKTLSAFVAEKDEASDEAP